MRRFMLAGALALACFATTGCAELRDAVSTVTQASVTPEEVTLAASAFDGFEVLATNYNRLRRCDGSNGPVCRDPSVTPVLRAAVRTGRVARNNLKQFLRDHPGQPLGTQGDYDALVAATKTIRDATAAYRTATTQ